MRLPTLSLFLAALSYVLAQDGCPAFTVETPTVVVPGLPDPFLSLSGSRITQKSDWACRRAEISALMQAQELGTFQPPPDSLTATLTPGANNTAALAITPTVGSNTVTFTVNINYPATGTGPFPALIAFDGVSIPLPAGIATIILNVDQIAQQNDQSSRGVGLFFNLFGSDADAGALIAWAWAVSRIVDALEMTPNVNIDLQHLAVTGCSRNGKGALVSGAFEERIALTIPQESGSGGDSCWRISDAMFAAGNVTQTAMEIVQENVWFSPNFDQFVFNTTLLQFDHHSLAAMVAPRALFSIENSDFLWLGPESNWGCMSTANTVWQALGIPDSQGYSQVGNHPHCQFPSDQQDQLFAFINKFLLGQEDADTNILTTDGNGWGFVPSDWIDWTVPTLQ